MVKNFKGRTVAIVGAIGLGAGILVWKAHKLSSLRKQYPRCKVTAELVTPMVTPFVTYAKASNLTLKLLGRPPIPFSYVVKTKQEMLDEHGVSGWMVFGWVEPTVFLGTGGDKDGEAFQAAVGHYYGEVSAKCHPGAGTIRFHVPMPPIADSVLAGLSAPLRAVKASA